MLTHHAILIAMDNFMCSTHIFVASQEYLQGKNQELQEQVQYLESQRLQHWEKADTTQCTAEDIKIYFNGRPDMEHDISISKTKCLSSEPLKCNTPENQQARDIHQTNGSSDTDNAQNAEEALHGYEEFKHERHASIVSLWSVHNFASMFLGTLSMEFPVHAGLL